MKCLVPVHFVDPGRVGGAEQMVYNLAEGLAVAGHDVELLTADPERLRWPAPSRVRVAPSGRASRGTARASRFLGEQLACLDRRLAGDLIVFPNYHTPALVPRRLGRVITVIHDLQYREFPQYFTARKRAWLRWAHRFTLRRAEVVVAISEFVRGTLVSVYGRVATRKVRVIHNPVCWGRFGEEARVEMGTGRPYLLSVAAHYPHKNLSTLIRAFAVVAKRRPEVDLVLAGQRASFLGAHVVAGEDLWGLARELGVERRVRLTGFVPDAELGGLYRRATVFAYPSLYEGFGLPPVEAMGLGIPTLTTRCASLPEVTLGRAHYVDAPLDVERWAGWLDAMLERPEAYRPSPQTIAEIRKRYAAEAIGKQYASVVEG
jgi:glycosyltransferase involved in cell wall biosynthesis